MHTPSALHAAQSPRTSVCSGCPLLVGVGIGTPPPLKPATGWAWGWGGSPNARCRSPLSAEDTLSWVGADREAARGAWRGLRGTLGEAALGRT